MRNHTTRHALAAHLLCTTLMVIIFAPRPSPAQIYLNPLQQNMNRSRVSIDMGDGLRCTSDGGSVPTLSLSVGAYPDQWGSDVTVFDRSTGSQSSLLGLVSVHVPLSGTSQKFDCNQLLTDAKIRARLDNLRELLDENIINDSQYRAAVILLYKDILDPSLNAGNAQPVSTLKRLEISEQKHHSTTESTRSIAFAAPNSNEVSPGQFHDTQEASPSQLQALTPPPALPPLPSEKEYKTPVSLWGNQQIANNN